MRACVISSLTMCLLLNVTLTSINGSGGGASCGAGTELPFDASLSSASDKRKSNFTFNLVDGNLTIAFDTGVNLAMPAVKPGSNFTISSSGAILDNRELSIFRPISGYGDIFWCMYQPDGSIFTSRLSDGNVEVIRPGGPARAVVPEVCVSGIAAAVPAPERIRPEDFYLREFQQMDTRGGLVLSLVLRFKREEFLKEAVTYGHCESMIALGEICQNRGEIDTAYKWFLLALETNWATAKDAAITKVAKAKLTEVFNLLPSKNGVKSKQHKAFLESFSGRKTLTTIAGAVVLPVLLSEDDKIKRKLGIEVTGFAPEDNPWGGLGDLYYEQKDFEKARICYRRCGCPSALN